jgi:hypothetical protein
MRSGVRWVRSPLTVGGEEHAHAGVGVPVEVARRGDLVLAGEHRLVDVLEADALLEERGHEHVRLVDNGNVQRREYLSGLEPTRVYDLVPKAASKASAVARHMHAGGHDRESYIAIGDSREDLGAAEAVGQFWLVANSVERDPASPRSWRASPDARLAGGACGEGVYEAVVTMLAAER